MTTTINLIKLKNLKSSKQRIIDLRFFRPKNLDWLSQLILYRGKHSSRAPLCGKPFVEMIAVMARYNPFAEHAGLRKIGESTLHPSISEAVARLEGLGFTAYMLAVPEYNLEKLEGQVDQVKEVLSSFKYPYNRRIAGDHGNYKMSDYREWLRTVEKEELTRALCRLAQLNQPKVYLFWSHEEAKCI